MLMGGRIGSGGAFGRGLGFVGFGVGVQPDVIELEHPVNLPGREAGTARGLPAGQVVPANGLRATEARPHTPAQLHKHPPHRCARGRQRRHLQAPAPRVLGRKAGQMLGKGAAIVLCLVEFKNGLCVRCQGFAQALIKRLRSFSRADTCRTSH